MRQAHTIEPERLAQVSSVTRALLAEVSRVFVGPSEIVENLLVAVLARGHVLLEGVPGVAKTTLAKAFAATLGCSYRRIQFTPDLLPADITGTYVLNPRDGAFVLREGPIFSNVVLGDEINRAPAKTQSALLEAMQESQVTIEGETRLLPPPFLVIATQNPIELAGTYPLPEAQIDRFLLRIVVGYPDRRDERRILQAHGAGSPVARPILGPREIIDLQSWATQVHVEEELYDYIIGIAGFTRTHGRVRLGASPRAALSLLMASRARALLHGRDFVLPDDVQHLAPTVIGHRLLLTPEAELEGFESGAVVAEALEKVSYRRELRGE